MPGLANHVLVRDDYAYVEDNNFGNGLWVIDVGEPERPRVIGSLPVDPSGLHTVSIAAGHAFLGTSFALEILSLENPASPQLVGTLASRTGFGSLIAADRFVFAANYFAGLEVIDATSPQSPRRVGAYRPEVGFLEEPCVAGAHAYVANRIAGLEVLDVSDPADPRRVGGNPVLGGMEIWQLAAAEGAVFAATGGEGLFIFDEFRDGAGSTPRFRRGDANDDGLLNLTDAVFTLNWLFLGGMAPGCIAAINTNGDGRHDIADATHLLDHLFLGGPAPAGPFPACGPGTSPADEENCETPPKHCRQ